MTPISIVFTDNRCTIDGLSRPAIPALVGPAGIVEPPSDWLRQLALDRNSPKSTLSEYAKILRDFWAHILEQRRPWEKVNDSLLRAWRDMMLRSGVKAGRINAKLRLVFNFYCWAEQTGRLEGVVQLDGRVGAYPISSKRTGVRGHYKYSSPLVFRVTSEPTRHTPTDGEIIALHARLEGRHAVRDGLILSWAEETGMRRFEILSLRLGQIPTREQIAALFEREEVDVLTIVGKGGGKGSIPVMPELLSRTRDYIDFERRECFALARERQPWLLRSEHVFLSDRGTPLTPDAVSHRMGLLFRDAGVLKAALHRLRAVHLTRIAERYVDLVDVDGYPLPIETVVLKVMEAARWTSPATIRLYVNQARTRRAFTLGRQTTGRSAPQT